MLSSKMTNTFHNGSGPGDTLLQFSTLGWMMWNYSVHQLALGVALVFYDGSPVTPFPILWQLVEKYKVRSLFFPSVDATWTDAFEFTGQLLGNLSSISPNPGHGQLSSPEAPQFKVSYASTGGKVQEWIGLDVC